MNIGEILSPVGLDQFLADYWESELLHVSRSDASYFKNLLTVAAIEAHLAEGDAVFPAVQLVRANGAIPIERYTEQNRKIDPQRLLQYHREQGATITISQAQQEFPELRHLCRGVSKSFKIRCQANVYLSPPGNQGFLSHYDTHDVFILQLSGSKTFRFYKSEIELPFPDDTYHPELNSGGAVLEKTTLKAGDTLYIPRGMVHDALADEKKSSLHITLGVFPFVVRDLLQQMVQVAAERDVKFRRSIDRLQTFENMSDLLGDVLSDEIHTEAVSRLADEVSTESAPLSNDSTPANRPKIDLNSTISVQDSVFLSIERRDDRLKLRLIGQIIHFDEPMSTAVEALVRKQSMKVKSLPGLDDEQKLALCDHLVWASVVTVG